MRHLLYTQALITMERCACDLLKPLLPFGKHGRTGACCMKSVSFFA